MNEKEKREYYQRVHSKNAVEIEAPIKTTKKRENLAAIVSLRFSGYELTLLRKLSKKQNMTLSALIRSFVNESLNKEKTVASNNLYSIFTGTLTSSATTEIKLDEDKVSLQTVVPATR